MLAARDLIARRRVRGVRQQRHVRAAVPAAAHGHSTTRSTRSSPSSGRRSRDRAYDELRRLERDVDRRAGAAGRRGAAGARLRRDLPGAGLAGRRAALGVQAASAVPVGRRPPIAYTAVLRPVPRRQLDRPRHRTCVSTERAPGRTTRTAGSRSTACSPCFPATTLARRRSCGGGDAGAERLLGRHRRAVPPPSSTSGSGSTPSSRTGRWWTAGSPTSTSRRRLLRRAGRIRARHRASSSPRCPGCSARRCAGSCCPASWTATTTRRTVVLDLAANLIKERLESWTSRRCSSRGRRPSRPAAHRARGAGRLPQRRPDVGRAAVVAPRRPHVAAAGPAPPYPFLLPARIDR